MEPEDHNGQASLSSLLRQYRVAARLSQEALAERARMSARAISDLERGVRRTPYRSTIEQLADALQLDRQGREALLIAARRVRTAASLRPRGDDIHVEDPLLATKLSVPPARSQIVARPQLLERLEAGLNGPLTLLAAPAGSGKTTLLSAWRASEGGKSRHVAWVSLDERDNDPVRLRRYVLAALDAAGVDVGEEHRRLVQMRRPPSVEFVLTSLLNALSRLRTEVVLVLDDYHVIDSEAIHQGVAFLLDHPSPYLRLIVATRADPPIPLARLRAGGSVSELRASDLRFSRAEAAEFLTEIMGLQLTGEDVELLEARTEGWITGLQLAALSLQGRPEEATNDFITSFAGSHRHVIDYLMDEVVGSLSGPVQAFLLRTSILDRLTASLCAFVMDEETGPEAVAASQGLLEMLERSNLFLVPLDDRREWYRFHHLFADAMRHRLRYQDPEYVSLLHERAATWFDAQGLIEEAIGYALEAGTFDHAADLIERAAPALHARGARLTMEAWLSAIPQEIAHARPRLAIMYTWMALDDGHVAWAERCLRTTEQALMDTTAPGEDRNLEGEIDAARALAATTRREPERAIAHAQQALERLDLDNAVTRGVVSISLGRAYIEQHDLSKAARVLDEALAIFRSLGNRYLGTRVMLYQSYVQRFQGRLQLATRTCQQALEWSDRSPYPDVCLIHLQLADLLRESNALDKALEHAVEGMALADLLKQPDLRIFPPLVLARLRQAQGDLGGALVALDEAKALVNVPEAVSYRYVIQACEAQIRLMQGDLAGAATHAHEAAREATEPSLELHPLSAYTYEHAIVAPIQILIGRARGARDPAQLATAREQLERQRGLAERVGLAWLCAKTFALEAMVHHASGEALCARAALQQALDLAQPEQYLRLFADEGEPMAELLRQAVGDGSGIAAGYLQRILDSAPLAPRPATARAS